MVQKNFTVTIVRHHGQNWPIVGLNLKVPRYTKNNPRTSLELYIAIAVMKGLQKSHLKFENILKGGKTHFERQNGQKWLILKLTFKLPRKTKKEF